MKVFIVYWHAEPQSFNGALFQTAQETLTAIGHDSGRPTCTTCVLNPCPIVGTSPQSKTPLLQPAK